MILSTTKKMLQVVFVKIMFESLKKNVQRGTVHKQTAIHVYTWSS